jgi:MYXO-CTERM domain-containing protein
VSVHEDLTGLGHPSAVVGSSDGWLYAINPCTLELDFAYDFGDAVGAAVFGDTDGDGFDEILVEVSDGYLYDLKQNVVAPGTGGAGGSGGAAGAGGLGGSGGGSGSGGKKGTGGSYDINGRATCACATPGDRSGSTLGLVAALALVTAAGARRRMRRTRG